MEASPPSVQTGSPSALLLPAGRALLASGGALLGHTQVKVKRAWVTSESSYYVSKPGFQMEKWKWQKNDLVVATYTESCFSVRIK